MANTVLYGKLRSSNQLCRFVAQEAVSDESECVLPIKRMVAWLMTIAALLCSSSAFAGWTWSMPSTVTVGDTFNVYARYNTRTPTISISSGSDNVVCLGGTRYQAVEAGSVTFSAKDRDSTAKSYYTVTVLRKYYQPEIFPESGSTFETDSLTVSMTCEADDATIHYTTNGLTPTLESPVYKKFRIYGKTTVKAIAVYEDGTVSEMTTAEYAKGVCVEPCVLPADGTSFEHSGQVVTLGHDNPEGTLRYTTDGNDPTDESAEYIGPLAIDETTTVKAKVFGVTLFDSAVVTATLTRVWLKVATPKISAPTQFTGSKQKVTIACVNEGAVIYYTTDGSEPTASSMRYDKPFCVTDSCTIKAVALRSDFLDSNVETMVITRQWSIGETLGKSDHVFATAGDEVFVRTDDTTAALGESMRSGAVKNSQTSILSTVIVGPGKLSFKWKTSCEEDYPLHEWDRAEFVVDDDVVLKLDGVTDWQPITHQIAGDGEHIIEWRYVKDAMDYGGEDCMWVSEYSWQSDYTETQTTDDPVPYSWLTEKCSDVVDEYDSYEKVAKQLALNGRLTVEQCYVAGVDPESATNDFRAVIKMVDGVPKITWDPDLKGLREYQIWGKATLDDSSAWQYPTNALHRFFKVMVEMP